MLSWSDGYCWMAKERRESGEDKREFAELLKQDWLEFDRVEIMMTSVHLEQNRQVYSVEGADAVI
jgi:hypothetical protein